MNVGFDEIEILTEAKEYLIRNLNLEEIIILKNNETHEIDDTNTSNTATPGKPAFFFYNN